MSTKHIYRFTEAQLPAVITAAYELSKPQGMGFMHFTPHPLTPDEVAYLVSQKTFYGCRLRMDYIKGRAIKLSIQADDDGRLSILGPDWYDHTPEALVELARIADIGVPEIVEVA